MPSMKTSSRPHVNKFTLTCAILSSMPLIFLGSDHFVSGLNIIREVEYINSDIHLSIPILVSIIVCPIASLAAGRTSERIGRRYTLLFSLIFLFFGYLPKIFGVNYAGVFFSVIFSVTGVGFAQMVTPLYVFELSPDSTRGFLSSFVEVFTILRTLISEIFYYFEIADDKSVHGIKIIHSLLLFVCVIFLPESPVWLVSRGKLGEAKRVLAKTSENSEAAELRLASLKSAFDIPEHCQTDVVSQPKRRSFARSLKELLLRSSPSIRRALIAAVGLNFFRQATGFEFVTGSLSTFLEKAKISPREVFLVTTVVRLINIGLVLIAGLLIDRIGRRPLLLTGMAGVIPSLAGLGLNRIASTDLDDKKIMAVYLAMSLSFSAFFAIGLGPITWVYSLEIFPPTLRNQGGSIGTAVNLVTGGVITLTFDYAKVNDRWGHIPIGGSFLVFAGVALVGWLYIYKLLPETRFGVSRESSGEVKIEDEEHVARSEASLNSNLEISTFERNVFITDARNLQKSATIPLCRHSTWRYQYLVGIRSE